MLPLARNRFSLPRSAHCFTRGMLSSRAISVLSNLGISTSEENKGLFDGDWGGTGELMESRNPSTGEVLARTTTATPREVSKAIEKAREAFLTWRLVPAPKRGEIVRQIREALAANIDDLGALITLEQGKILTEGKGEVQEGVDICDYAIGLSRMLNGRVVPSERPGHVIHEVPNPLGVVGVLSASNFPHAVYLWNLAILLITGNASVWKPSPLTPLTSLATTRLVSRVLAANNLPGALASLTLGDTAVGKEIVGNAGVDMVSFTGSEKVGKEVGKVVQGRFGKVLLELGGNAAAVVMSDADLDVALPAVLFASVGTAGQRCTSTRRLLLHRPIADQFLSRLTTAYTTLRIGDPLSPSSHVGPVHTPSVVSAYSSALSSLASSPNTRLLAGGETLSLSGELAGGNFVRPAIVLHEKGHAHEALQEECFAPVLQVAVFDELEEAIAWNNAVRQGLGSSLFTRDMRNVFKWIGPAGSECGLVNVNCGTSGAEIGAAFGGNKATGWGRESGGEAWKQYVRWSSCAINYSNEVPLAQGVSFST